MTDVDEREADIEHFWGRVHQPWASVEFDEALREFLRRIPSDVFAAIQRANPIVVDSTVGSTVGRFSVPCLESTTEKPDVRSIFQATRHIAFLHVVVISAYGFKEKSHMARVGLMAHEFAHLFGPLVYAPNSTEGDGEADAEAAADDQAQRWGFAEEIKALNGDRENPR